MSRHVSTALILVEVALNEEVLRIVALEIDKGLGVEGAIGTTSDFDDFTLKVGSHILKPVQRRQRRVAHRVHLALNAGAAPGDVEQIRTKVGAGWGGHGLDWASARGRDAGGAYRRRGDTG